MKLKESSVRPISDVNFLLLIGTETGNQLKVEPFQALVLLKKELKEVEGELREDPLEVENTSRLPQTYWNTCMLNRGGESSFIFTNIVLSYTPNQ